MGWRGTSKRSLPVLVVLVLTGCMLMTGCMLRGDPRDNFELTPEQLQNREMRTRTYEGISEVDILSACAAVLQDLEFTIDETEAKLGVIVGSKRSDATEVGQEAWWLVKALLTYGWTAFTDETDDYQVFRASVVVRPMSTANAGHHAVSVTFQRTVWDTDDKISKQETLEVTEIYQDFFDRLSKSVFLEEQGI